MLTPSRTNVLWLAAYLATMAAVVWLLLVARERVIANLSQPAAQAQWEEWKADETARQADPQSPVRRRPPKSAEPPALVLMRDSFAAIVVMFVLAASVCFGFAMLTLRGGVASQRRL